MSANQIVQLSKHLTREDIETINTLKSAVENNEIIVTCMGLYNHGKSSLLNVLVGDFEEKTFKVADVRETAQNKKLKIDNITYVDTPGLNAKEHDDKRVMDAAKESDINIFVHNVNTGEFVAKEIEFLHMIKTNWKYPQEFIERTIFVLSRIDEAGNEDDIENTIAKMKQQIRDIFGIDSLFVPVSSKDYIEGINAKENELIELSNISQLKKNLDSFAKLLQNELQKTKEDRLANFCEQLIKKLNGKLEENKLELSKLKELHKDIEFKLKDRIQKIESTLKQKIKILREV